MRMGLPKLLTSDHGERISKWASQENHGFAEDKMSLYNTISPTGTTESQLNCHFKPIDLMSTGIRLLNRCLLNIVVNKKNGIVY